MSRDVMRDLIGAGLILAVAAVFWSRQDFDTPEDVIFPRFVLVVLTLLALSLAAMAMVRARGGSGTAGGRSRTGAAEELPPEAARMQARHRHDAGESGTAAPGASAAGATATEDQPGGRPAADGSAGPEDEGEDEEPAPTPGRRPHWVLPAACALLIGWAAAFGLFGITLSGVVAFVVTAVLIRRGTGTARRFLLDVAVALVVVLFCWAVFTRALLVPLPVSVILGV